MNLIIAAIIGIAAIVLLIAVVKIHPFLSLMIGSFVMAVCAGVPFDESWDSFTSGVGSTVSNVGLLIALGSIVGTLLFASGGADVIVDTIMSKTPLQMLPWAMALIAFVVGIPMFFEVGVVILIPVVLFAARRAKMPVVLLGIPALAGLSTLHAFVPPHPGPLVAISALNANLGVTLGLGLLVAIPTVIISGPLMGRLMAKWVPIQAPEQEAEKDAKKDASQRPSFAQALTVILLPVVLMLAASVVDLTGQAKTLWGRVIVFIGTPLTALFITAVVAMILLGFMQHRTREFINGEVGKSFGSVAGILLIVGAGGGFKQTLVDSGIGDVIANGITESAMNPLFAGWLVAVLIRLATGSATVATVTASGIMVPLAAGMSPTHLALLVLAIGAGSVFFSHLNDAGFWLVKEYFGMSVSQTIKTWSLMETMVSVVGLGCVMLLSLVL
ncbi:GntP family permease [Bifidobacterium scardovii]|uniref:Gluconate transporter n=1 Tax=Bifidobacterium scardovii TaxID=158787 RepID=A0A087DE03_9BIFI|nr:gluconate:H+ symporter [Bifidobacterium scardovii]KFI93753.1 gluconate transporter [Bifidobacterium scardovii]MBS6946921.1 gluconate:H+ symporter [Bifidobacterium scardovii]MDK6350537.1 gluconate:H+ symporter [Bifidobacterium scardovii]MDU2422124.1 gluconate:H+ symporter [Bifidobacterium scardovii]MDU3736669.1 gluconate:H+ symporter [Bifidobacterium scardovii]